MKKFVFNSAFMVANLFSHSNLFTAGIARSGAYNRTLIPFGFQSEEHSYWEEPDVYNTMAPFMHADKMRTRYYRFMARQLTIRAPI